MYLMRLENVMRMILGIYRILNFIQNKFTNFFSVAGQDGLRYWRDSQGSTNHLEKL